jgi:hypothetical protein
MRRFSPAAAGKSNGKQSCQRYSGADGHCLGLTRIDGHLGGVKVIFMSAFVRADKKTPPQTG